MFTHFLPNFSSNPQFSRYPLRPSAAICAKDTKSWCAIALRITRWRRFSSAKTRCSCCFRRKRCTSMASCSWHPRISLVSWVKTSQLWVPSHGDLLTGPIHRDSWAMGITIVTLPELDGFASRGMGVHARQKTRICLGENTLQPTDQKVNS